MYTNDRDAYRRAFFTAWEKHIKKLPMDAVELQLVEIILLHPEYEVLFAQPNAYQKQEFQLEENPFLHLSLHLAIREQILTDRPVGIKQIKDELITTYQNPHDVEHRMMQCLANIMWTAQQAGEMPSETDYLAQLKLI